MSKEERLLYKIVNVCRRMGNGEVVVYRCLEVLSGRGFVVQSADRVRLPVPMEELHQHERQFWELLCEGAPEERDKLYPSLEQAIAAFDAEFDN